MPPESQIPIASPEAPQRFAARLALFYATLFGLVGTQLPFFPVWLKAVGIDASWIGIITAVPSVTRFTTLPFVTGFAEKHRSVRGALIATAFLSALGFLSSAPSTGRCWYSSPSRSPPACGRQWCP